jgi:hypothetical protein
MKSAGEPEGSAANDDDRLGLGDSHGEMRWETAYQIVQYFYIYSYSSIYLHVSTASMPTPASAGAAEKWTTGRVPDVPKQAFLDDF